MQKQQRRQGRLRQFVQITSGVMIREYYPHETNNRCLDCARAAELSNDGNEVEWRCTLQCTRKEETQKNDMKNINVDL